MSRLNHFRTFWSAPTRVLIAVVLVTVAIPAQAQYTDEVVLWDGNSILGDVKNLQQAKLEFKINKAGTIYIEWDRVHYLRSNRLFEVENREGQFFYGDLGAGIEERQLMVRGLGVNSILYMDDVVMIRPIKKTFWGRVDGSLNAGLSFTSAQSIFQYNFEGQATYRREKYQSGIRLTSFQTRQEDQDDTIRDNFDFNYTRYHKKRYFSTGTFTWNRSSELGLKYRVQIGYAFGRVFVQSNRSRLRGSLGFALSREQPIGDEPKNDSAWATIGGRYRFFLYAFPKTDITVDLVLLPSLTDSPRFRADFNGSIRREIFKDVTLSFSVFDSYDSDPAPEAVSDHDFGMVFSVGWSP